MSSVVTESGVGSAFTLHNTGDIWDCHNATAACIMKYSENMDTIMCGSYLILSVEHFQKVSVWRYEITKTLNGKIVVCGLRSSPNIAFVDMRDEGAERLKWIAAHYQPVEFLYGENNGGFALMIPIPKDTPLGTFEEMIDYARNKDELREIQSRINGGLT